MFLVERNGSNPFSLSAQENTLFSVQIVFGWRTLVGVEVVEGGAGDFAMGMSLIYAGFEDRSVYFCAQRVYIQYSKSALQYILYHTYVYMNLTV